MSAAIAAPILFAAPSAQHAQAGPDTPAAAQFAQNLPVPLPGADEAGGDNPFAPMTEGALPAPAAPGAAGPGMSSTGTNNSGFGRLTISDLADFARPVLRAQISPRRQTVLSAEISGKIDTFPLREGERFAQGDPLVGFDCAVHVARRDRSRAQEQSARRRLETAGRLDALSSISRLEYDETVAAVAVAEAETALSEIAVSRCTIAAPFPGRVAERLAEPFQYVAEGEPVIAILDDRDLEVALMVPSRWLAWLRPGHAFEVAIDELESTLEASISRIGARVDPVSQSIRIFAAITRAPEGLMAGMSGEADLRPPAPDGASDGAP
ncbi:MAG: efflux RND transporter periplasmic adaptor subunit [Salinarimonas sp.]